MPELQTHSMSESRKQRLIPLLKEVLEDTSGLDIASASEVTTFLEMGLDSILNSSSDRPEEKIQCQNHFPAIVRGLSQFNYPS
jgi:hypothetical protein